MKESDVGCRCFVSHQPTFYIFTGTKTPCQQRKLNHTQVFLTFHHILLVVTVIVTVCRSIIDIKAMDWSVVVACWNILLGSGEEKKHVGNGAEKSSGEQNH